MTAKEKAVVALHWQGKAPTTIAKALGLGRRAVGRILRPFVTPNLRGPYARALEEVEVSHILADYREGMTVKRLSVKYRRGSRLLSSLLKGSGILRKHGGQVTKLKPKEAVSALNDVLSRHL